MSGPGAGGAQDAPAPSWMASQPVMPLVMPLVMGVLNVTPDSFSDGGRFLGADAAIAHGLEMIAEGADVVDVGGESSRPGADAVGTTEQIRRVVPVIEALADGSVRVSVDTRDAEVARAAVRAGATLINDISASLWPVAADLGAGWVAMHMAGDPTDMQVSPSYDDVVAEVSSFLVERAERAVAAGVVEVWIDPGIGFGKSLDHNLALLGSVDRLVATGWPVLIGTSRKSSLGVLTGRSDARVGIGDGSATPATDRFEASLATATWAMSAGVRMVRAHDVRAHRHAAAVVAGSIPAR